MKHNTSRNTRTRHKHALFAIICQSFLFIKLIKLIAPTNGYRLGTVNNFLLVGGGVGRCKPVFRSCKRHTNSTCIGEEKIKCTYICTLSSQANRVTKKFIGKCFFTRVKVSSP